MNLDMIFEWTAGVGMVVLMCYAVYKYTKQNHDYKI